MVCRKDFEVRHPQDFVRGVPDKSQTLPWTRPEPEPIFREVCDLWSSAARADFGTADCMLVGNTPTVELLIDVFDPSCIAGIAIAGRSIPGVLTYV
jgi:hypothetical protein